MPIRPENRARYPGNWRAISLWVRRDRAKWKCEDCGAENGKPHPITGSRVVLTVAHLDHQPENCAPDNLRAWCQRCHLRYDAAHHATNARRTREARSGQAALDLGRADA